MFTFGGPQIRTCRIMQPHPQVQAADGSIVALAEEVLGTKQSYMAPQLTGDEANDGKLQQAGRAVDISDSRSFQLGANCAFFGIFYEIYALRGNWGWGGCILLKMHIEKGFSKSRVGELGRSLRL